MIVVNVDEIKQLDKYLYIGWTGAVYILLAKICKCTFNLFINNVAWEPVFDKNLFHVI